MLGGKNRFVAGSALLLLGTMTWTQCSNGTQPAPAPAAAPSLADMTPVVSIRELMSGMIDPLADNIWDAVYWSSTPQGSVEVTPKTDEDWEKVRIGALSIAEGIYLLKVPREPTPPGDVNNSTGPNPPELSPTQIKEKIAKDPGTLGRENSGDAKRGARGARGREEEGCGRAFRGWRRPRRRLRGVPSRILVPRRQEDRRRVEQRKGDDREAREPGCAGCTSAEIT